MLTSQQGLGSLLLWLAAMLTACSGGGPIEVAPGGSAGSGGSTGTAGGSSGEAGSGGSSGSADDGDAASLDVHTHDMDSTLPEAAPVDAARDRGSRMDGADASACRPAGTLIVQADGSFAYTIDGLMADNPSVVLCRGNTYTFAVNAPGHPFYIMSEAPTGGPGDVYDSGVSGNGVTTGDLIFVVSESAPDRLYYQCSLHLSMLGDILIVDD